MKILYHETSSPAPWRLAEVRGPDNGSLAAVTETIEIL